MNELDLINAAKKGDIRATANLWYLHEKFMKATHDYGLLGKLCDRWTRSRYSCDFDEISDEIYMTFLDAIRLYDANMGASFRTFLGNKMRWDAKSYIRRQTPHVTLKTGERVPVTMVNYEKLMECLERLKNHEELDDLDCTESDEHDPSKLVNNGKGKNPKKEEPSEDLKRAKKDETINLKTAAIDAYKKGDYFIDPNTTDEGAAARYKVRHILSLFKEGDTARKVLEAYLKLADFYGEDPSVREIGEELGCSGANVSGHMQKIRRLLQNNGITRLSAG